MNGRLAAIIRLTFIFVVAFGLGGLVGFARAVYLPNGSIDRAVTVTVQPGDGPRDIATHLKNQGLIGHERPFYLYVLITGKRQQFYPGTHDLPARPSLRQIVAILTDPAGKQTPLTVIEGWRIADIAKALSEKTTITAVQFTAAAPVESYEGYLFPDTYYLGLQTTAADLVKLMRTNFDKQTADLQLRAEDVMLASIVEREAKRDEDRAKIAGVYVNRLKINMALEADPTVQYAKGSWEPITTADYKSVQSPYNTYLHRGLPPTPIANPGLKSLQAVKNPAIHDYYYFFTPSNGETVYSRTLSEHNLNKAKYLR